MARLPLTESWSGDLIGARLEFLARAARTRVDLPPPDVEPRPAGEQRPGRHPEPPASELVDVRPVFGAADLALATGHTARALIFLREVTDAILSRRPDSHPCDAALPGAVALSVSTKLAPDRIWLATVHDRPKPWSVPPPPMTSAGLELMRDLMCAQVASSGSGSLPDAVQLAGGGAPLPLAQLQPVSGALRVLAVDDAPPGSDTRAADFALAGAALASMTLAWASDLALQAHDEHHWSEARYRGSLIDYRRLALELALLRRRERARYTGEFLDWRARQPPPGGLPGEIERYVIALAQEIARNT